MATITSRAALLHAAVQDLHAGKRDATQRLDRLADKADLRALTMLLRAEVARARDQVARLDEAGVNGGGQPNLWMAGILDDAERDGRQTAPGPLLDVALVGAVRKAKAAEIVSSETAILLARALDETAIGAAVAANREEEVDTDRALRSLLGVLTG